ncbi:hypothetical protein [Streptomyces sp. NPDC091371]
MVTAPILIAAGNLRTMVPLARSRHVLRPWHHETTETEKDT